MFLGIIVRDTRPLLEINERFFQWSFLLRILLLRPLIEETFVCAVHLQDQHVPNRWPYEPREQVTN